jgi:hypothetical protein
MLDAMEMFGGVFVLRRVATSDVPAGEAQAQMYPGIAHLHALFADAFIRARNLDLIQMLALS